VVILVFRGNAVAGKWIQNLAHWISRRMTERLDWIREAKVEISRRQTRAFRKAFKSKKLATS